MNNKYNFYFETYIEDEATDLAFFINDVNFQVSKEYNMTKDNISIEVNRKIGKN